MYTVLGEEMNLSQQNKIRFKLDLELFYSTMWALIEIPHYACKMLI